MSFFLQKTKGIKLFEGKCYNFQMHQYTHPILLGKFLKRYKRFFADVELEDGTCVTAHTPNTGSMRGLLIERNDVLVSHNPSPKRKLQYTLEAIKIDGEWVGVNTMLPNKVVQTAIEENHIKELAGYESITPEVRYGLEGKSRIDLLLSEHASLPSAYVEIKNVTLREENFALFPDAVTERGQKHLRELMLMKAEGMRAVMFYFIPRTDCTVFSPAKAIDPTYANLLKEAAASGVEVLAYMGQVSQEGIELGKKVEVKL